jgi:O-antigen/teichoic acid export membrane protein
VLAATAIYSLASLPLALHYLSTDRFGLWTLMSGISGYLSLIDLGMSSSVSRLLVDHKDDKQAGVYGSLIKTGWLVLAVQSVIIFLAGYALAPVLSKLLAIQPDLEGDFIKLMRWQSATLATGLVMRIFWHALLAHQRVDVINYSQILMLVTNFALLWLFFHIGQGVFSLVWAALLSSIGSALLPLVACWKLRLLPPTGAWGRPSWERFKEIFGFGKDLFLVSVGHQLLSASQTMIITRRLGLAESAMWYAGTRAFTLVSWAIWRISDVSGPAFSEMIVRGEQTLLRERYKSVLVLTASLSGVAAVTYALCNSLFVTVWTHHRMDWPPLNDVLLGVWMIIMALVHCHNAFALQSKKVGFMRYVYFIEGLVFVSAALLTTGWGGLRAIIISSIVCSTVFSGAYGVWRISHFFNLPIKEVALRWLAPMGRVLLFFTPIALAGWWAFGMVQDPVLRLVLNVLLSVLAGLYLFLRLGLPQGLQHELLHRAPKAFNPVLRWVFVGAGQ